MNLRIKPGTVQLPHRISKGGVTYEFKPDAVVPDAVGDGLIKTYPDVYIVAAGPANLADYVFKPTFQVETVYNLLSTLTEDELVEVYDYAKDFIAKRTPAKTAPIETETQVPAAAAKSISTAAPKSAQAVPAKAAAAAPKK